MPVASPFRTFRSLKPVTRMVDSSSLLRISRYNTGEPYFGKNKTNRFDDPNRAKGKRFGVSYFGLGLDVAFAETVLHDEEPVKGRFSIRPSVLDQAFVVTFAGRALMLLDFTGKHLKRYGADNWVSATDDYSQTQKWAAAIHAHPANVDGFIYVSRHVNNMEAVALFERAAPKISAKAYTNLPDYPGALRTVMSFSVGLSDD